MTLAEWIEAMPYNPIEIRIASIHSDDVYTVMGREVG